MAEVNFKETEKNVDEDLFVNDEGKAEPVEKSKSFHPIAWAEDHPLITGIALGAIGVGIGVVIYKGRHSVTAVKDAAEVIDSTANYLENIPEQINAAAEVAKTTAEVVA